MVICHLTLDILNLKELITTTADDILVLLFEKKMVLEIHVNEMPGSIFSAK